MHPLYQILQIITVGGQRYIDRNNNFGRWVSLIIWQPFMLLMIWILVFRHSIRALKYYINDVFSVAGAGNISWYKPHCQAIPTDQAKILHLWDGICLPHVDKIQVAGRTVTILEFEVDANAISVYLSVERWELADSIHKFTWGSSKMLWDWLRLAGQLNWALNVYPWLRPGLGRIYMKMAGETQMWGRIKINKTVQRELAWFVEHVQLLSGLFFFKAMAWWEDNVRHLTLMIHVNVSMWGLGIWFLSEKSGCQCLTDAIFFFDALVVCSAIHISEHFLCVS